MLVGQAKDKNGRPGQNQKEQKDVHPGRFVQSWLHCLTHDFVRSQVIVKLKDGTFNIIVASSVGEEGLDIGSVDKVIRYDVTSDPIKTVRTSTLVSFSSTHAQSDSILAFTASTLRSSRPKASWRCHHADE